MNCPLTSCGIIHPRADTVPDFAPMASSLLYQSTALGMEMQPDENPPDNSAFRFEFRTPQTAPVRCNVTRWSDAARQGEATENILQAACGLMSVHGRATGQSRPLGLNYVSTLTAVLALQGGIAASVGQIRGLALSSCSISMAAAALLSMGQYIAGATASELPEKLLPGRIHHPPCPPFVSLDGVIFELETLDAGPWLKFWSGIGISSVTAGKGWTAYLSRYAKAISPLPDELSDAISNLTYAHIVQLCARTGMAVCPLRSIEERAKDEDSRHVWQQGPLAFNFGMERDSQPLSGATGHLPLSGFTVIESCRRIQGPLAGHLLALLGASVIRIEPPGGDPLRGMPPIAEGCSARFDALNRLKTIREIDIKSSSGQAGLKDMVRDADVFLHNWMPGKAVLFNLDHDDLSAINPSLIYAYAGGWATDNAAHISSNSLPGTDFMAQAYSGVARKVAGSAGTRGGSLFTALDVLGGAIAAQGVTVALLHKCMKRTGATVVSSLMSAATLLCAEDFQKLYSMPGCKDETRSSPVNTICITKRGKIAIECPDLNTSVRLAKVLGAAATDVIEADPDTCPDNVFLLRTADEWVEILGRAGIPVSVLIEDLADLQSMPFLRPDLRPGSYTQVNSPWRFK